VEKEEAERQHQRNKKKHGKQGVDLEYINEWRRIVKKTIRGEIKMEKCRRKEFRGLPSFPTGNFVYMMYCKKLNPTIGTFGWWLIFLFPAVAQSEIIQQTQWWLISE
jgi:hypothetical protein